jgi:hypothetical protein
VHHQAHAKTPADRGIDASRSPQRAENDVAVPRGDGRTAPFAASYQRPGLAGSSSSAATAGAN